MDKTTPHLPSTAARVTSTIYLLLFPTAVVCFAGVLLTDIAYAKSAELMWLHFSEWLNAAGLAFGALGAIVLVIALLASRGLRAAGISWTHLALLGAVLIVELINALVHTIDGWTAVVPIGMALSVAGAALALAAVATRFRMHNVWTMPREVLP